MNYPSGGNEQYHLPSTPTKRRFGFIEKEIVGFANMRLQSNSARTWRLGCHYRPPIAYLGLVGPSAESRETNNP